MGGAKIDASKGTRTENTINMTDHSTARLKRLVDAGRKNAEEVRWAEVTQPDLEFQGIGIGTFIEWECDVYVADGLSAFANSDELKSGIEAMRSMLRFVETLGLDTPGAPDLDKLDAMKSVMNNLDVALVVIGDDSETEWKIVGSLDKKGFQRQQNSTDAFVSLQKSKSGNLRSLVSVAFFAWHEFSEPG